MFVGNQSPRSKALPTESYCSILDGLCISRRFGGHSKFATIVNEVEVCSGLHPCPMFIVHNGNCQVTKLYLIN